MSPLAKLTLVGALAVLAFDAVSAVASRMLDFAYTDTAIGSYLIYGTVGFFAGRRFGVGKSALVGALLGVFDASLGWAASALLGANTPPTPELSALLWMTIAVSVALTAAIAAAIGGALGRMTQKPPVASA